MLHGNGQWHRLMQRTSFIYNGTKPKDREKKLAGIRVVTNEYTNKQHLG